MTLQKGDLYDFPRPLGGYRLYAIREVYTWGADRSRARVQVQELTDYMLDLKRVLLENENRRKGVRRIFLDIDRLLCKEFGGVLEIVKDTLETLELYPPTFPYSSLSQRPLYTIKQLFADSSIRLDRLRHLSLPLGLNWDETLTSVLKYTPNLTTLHLSSMQPYSGSWGDTIVFPGMKSGFSATEIPSLPWVKELEVDEMSESFEKVLTALVDGARDLRRVGLRDPSESWTPEEGNGLLLALSRCKGLRYLGITGRCLAKTEGMDGSDTLEEVSLVQDTRPWGAHVIDVGHIPTMRSQLTLFSPSTFLHSHI
jgi:hypothetical protein